MSTTHPLTALTLAGALVGALATAGEAQTVEPLEQAYYLFYNARYAEAAALSEPRCTSEQIDLAACELATSALHFEIKRLLQLPGVARKWQRCTDCQPLLTRFLSTMTRGQQHARTLVANRSADLDTRFLLAKLDLNYVWLHLGAIGRRTGLKEYREGRRLLDEVLSMEPQHVRARVARAWIDYIVDTRMPLGTRWMLGGGDRKKGLRVVLDAAATPSNFIASTEALFALWDMQTREKDLAAAVATARRLAATFPQNEELARFLAAHDE